MRALVSAYNCEPRAGSEPGAGYSIVRAASNVAECWVLTRANNVRAIESDLRSNPPTHPVHVVGVDASETALRLKRRLGAVRPYYLLWQRAARQAAERLERDVGPFEVVHHATMSAFWMPMGVVGTSSSFVVGPLSGGTSTPRRLGRYLGVRGRLLEAVRNLNIRFAAAWSKGQLRKASVIIAQNQQMRELVERLVVGPKVITHSHASDADVSGIPFPTERSSAVLFVGRLVSWKGPQLALEAFSTVASADARMVFIGSGPEGERLRRYADRIGVGDRVEFTGPLPRDQVLAMLAEATCLLFPSFHDSAGFVVSESLSLGTPVVCLDHGGPGTLVQLWPSVPSCAVPIGISSRSTVTALARAVDGLLEQPAMIPEAPISAAVTLDHVIAEVYSTVAGGRS